MEIILKLYDADGREITLLPKALKKLNYLISIGIMPRICEGIYISNKEYDGDKLDITDINYYINGRDEDIDGIEIGIFVNIFIEDLIERIKSQQ